MILFPQQPFYCGVHELSNATVSFSSPPGTLSGRKHGFALFTRKGDFGQQKLTRHKKPFAGPLDRHSVATALTRALTRLVQNENKPKKKTQTLCGPWVCFY